MVVCARPEVLVMEEPGAGVEAGLPSTPHWTPGVRLSPQEKAVPLLICTLLYLYISFLATFSF